MQTDRHRIIGLYWTTNEWTDQAVENHGEWDLITCLFRDTEKS